MGDDGLTEKEWRERISRRSDFTCGLVHLTKPNEDLGMNGFEVLMKILEEKTLRGSNKGFICGSDNVVCFQDVPLQSISENIHYEQKLRKEKATTKRYSAFGLRFAKEVIFKAGGRPVIYEKMIEAKRFLPKSEYWRIVSFDLSDKNNIIDWTHEREWRIKGDFHFEWNQVEVLLSKETSFNKFYNYCKDHDLEDMLNEINGIIKLKSIVF